MNATRLLAALVILQAVTLVSLWGGLWRPAEAQAQIPDAGAQRVQMIQELRAANERIDRLTQMLERGNVQVRTVSPDENR